MAEDVILNTVFGLWHQSAGTVDLKEGSGRCFRKREMVVILMGIQVRQEHHNHDVSITDQTDDYQDENRMLKWSYSEEYAITRRYTSYGICSLDNQELQGITF
ncbi:PREDICTED: uncharacterized protein LOC106292920 isoform X1 [Brassica oleracea var. oleracea]|uniref:uncharacterized protein LOC106292920 isoform X1 n=1 Tax=Brassica oleracea var. oleracea TaxID=109376 RepID=UPI0006A6F95E|nr:PREDICTED: uncharacterized protein LOC106292920 isoform X1 [Brassica oleracea var. oleracea]